MRLWPGGLVEDVRHGVRNLTRHPGFSLVVVATLAIGIGINAAVFTLASAFLFRGFPDVEDNERIVYISSRGTACCVSYPDFEDIRDQARSFEGIEVVHGFPLRFDDDRGFPEVFDVTEVSAGTFRLIGQAPLIGRDFTPADAAVGAAPVAILSHGLWERRYARDPAVIGRTIGLDGVPTTVIGVMPRGVSFPQKQELWLPIIPTEEVRRRERRDLWFAFGRLHEGVTIDQARVEVATIGERLASMYPETNRPRDLLGVSTFNEFFVESGENALYGSMWGAVAFVLLIACANLANLMLARAIGRSREVSIRIALGASRLRIIRQLLSESVLLSVIAGLIGWWLAQWCVRLYAFAAHGPGWSPWRVLDYTMDDRVLAYVIAVSVATGLLFGLAPAKQLSKVDVNAALKDGARAATSGASTKRLSSTLVIAQVALAVVLLIGAGVMIRSLLNVSTANTGIESKNALTAFLSLPESRYASNDSRISFYERLGTRLEAHPGIESVAFVDYLPTWGAARAQLELADRPVAEESGREQTSSIVVTPGYFDTLGGRVLAGRPFFTSDREASLPVAIVNQRFAAEHWPGEDALGKRLRLFAQTESAWLTVIGVVSNIVQADATRQSFDPIVYLPLRQSASAAMWIVARTRVPPEGLGTDLRREVQALDPDLPIRFGPFALSDRLADVYGDRALYVALFLIFSTVALMLASIGLYAIVAHTVNRHTQEIGIRLAIGATASDIRELILKIGLLPTVIGLGLGLVMSLSVTRVLQAELVGVSPADPLTYLVACGVLGFAALLGCFLPARRAMRIDPVIALRHD